MKRKLLSMLLVCALTLTSLVGCTSQSKPTSNASSNQSSASSQETIKFTDSAGREVEIPANIERIAPMGTLAQIVLFSIAPDKLIGLSNDWSDRAKSILDNKYATLPVFGQFYGGGNLNMEAIAAADPQVIMDIGEFKEGAAEDLDAVQEQTGIPTIFIEASTKTMADCYTTLGELLNEQEKGKALADYCKNTYDTTINTMEKIGEENKVKMLYCTGDTGTNVVAKGSFHAEMVDILGNNLAVMDDISSTGKGNETSLEQIYIWNPDVIIFGPNSAYSTVGEDEDWQQINAIKNGKYYESPNVPYNWMGTPPSVNRYMGLIWMSQILYPDEFNYDLKEKTKEYYKLFYNVDLTDEQYEDITKNAK